MSCEGAKFGEDLSVVSAELFAEPTVKTKLTSSGYLFIGYLT
jgi:hypothetical protein